MKKRFLCLLLVLLLMTGCYIGALIDDDFAYSRLDDIDISVPVEGNIYVISEVENQLLDIALEYSEIIKFTGAEYKFYNEEDGGAIFYFYGEYEKYGIGYDIEISIHIDLYEKKAYRLFYNEGGGRAVGSNHSDCMINRNKEKNALDIYNYSKDYGAYYTPELDCVKIRFFGDEIVAYYIAESGSLIDRYTVE